MHVPSAKPSAKSGHRTENADVVIGGQGYLVTYIAACIITLLRLSVSVSNAQS